MTEGKYISRTEAASQFGCAPQTISNWLSDGFLQGKKINGMTYITRESFNAIMDEDKDGLRPPMTAEEYREKVAYQNAYFAERIEEIKKKGLKRIQEVAFFGVKMKPKELVELLCKITNTNLSDREKYILQASLCMSIPEIAKDVNLTPERTRQIFEKSNRKLMKHTNRIEELEEENKKLAERAYQQHLHIQDLQSNKKHKDLQSNKKQSLLNRKLTDFEFSERVTNIFKATDIRTIGDLCGKTRRELMRYRNLGKKSMNEIDMFMDRLKLTFKDNNGAICNNKRCSTIQE
jgi:hypothetical protein